ncbi:MAG: hypothetical protein E5V49_15745 [Mesorhizobium sp.]|nr:hypothetical protein EN848_11125 [bacterium M00.F.Ca.ET.205.01.1.1]TGU55504.1 hypothetical protein EN795_01900 [bacterium M00.F.Ca.ET.152.01.1.1]TGV40215.1 hypothetical protein EN829_002540 [Mesorhizobium sp. M00.F.Ca.ET.186.01.1.1]TGZ45202.1 hypothetical protein EN805_02520 [bacterium M00.F.Ca.ET.162.01.1.1]TJW31610.1 MAG: hypothetical protein E5V49_15745 [Mesorhizobium sp.]
MSLDISAQDIIIDETTGLQNDDIDPSDPLYSGNSTLLYLQGLGTPLEVAYKADFVTATAGLGETINSVFLAQDSSGTAFSSDGVVTNIRTVDGNYVWLFQDPNNADVVIGVIGTSDNTAAGEPDPLLDPIAFSFALDGGGTSPDLYLVQYVPLLNPNTGNPDDRIDLTGLVYASVTGTSVLNFSQLGDAPPGHNKWYILDADVASTQKILVTAHDNGVQAEVNVSTQGLGVSSQDVRFGRELQIDLINGGTQSAGKNFTNTPTAPNYDTHIETVSSAGFSVSQSTPTNTKADIEVHAYNNAEDAEGAALPTDPNDHEVNIGDVSFKLNGVTLTAAQVTQLGITVDYSGLGVILHNVGQGITVDFTADATFDRFTIKNVDTQKDYFDVKEVHFGTDQTNVANAEVGSLINFDDDGPSILPSGSGVPTLVVGDSDFGTDASDNFSSLFTPDFGTDGPAATDDVTYTLGVVGGGSDVHSNVFDTLSGLEVLLNVEGSDVVGRAGTDEVFRISVDADGNVTLDQSRAVVHDNPDDPVESGASAVTLTASLVTLTATATDGDGDTASTHVDIGGAFSFEDTGPAIAVENASGDYDSGAQGTWTHDNGADGFNLLSVTLDSYTIDSNATVASGLSLTPTGDYSFTGSIHDDFNGDGTAEDVGFTLTFDPVAGTYDLDVDTPPGTITTFDTTQGSLKAGGPDAVQTLQFPPTGPDNDVVFFAALVTAPLENGAGNSPNDIEDLVSNDPTEATLEGYNATSLIASSFKMNVSTSGIGVNNNNLDGVSGGTPLFAGTSITAGDESFVVNPEEDVDKVTVYIDNSVGGYNPATEDLYYTIYYTDGTVSTPTEVTGGMLHNAPRHDPLIPDVAEGGKYFEIDGGAKQIEAIQLTMGVGTVKIPVIQFTIEQESNPAPIDLDFTANLVDGDNDSSPDTFSVHVDVA